MPLLCRPADVHKCKHDGPFLPAQGSAAGRQRHHTITFGTTTFHSPPPTTPQPPPPLPSVRPHPTTRAPSMSTLAYLDVTSGIQTLIVIRQLNEFISQVEARLQKYVCPEILRHATDRAGRTPVPPISMLNSFASANLRNFFPRQAPRMDSSTPRQH